MRIATSTYRRIQHGSPLAAGGAAIAIVAGMFLGWFRSGSRMRNSFELFRIPQQLGLEGFTTIRVVWFLVPVFAAAVVGFTALGRRGLAAGILALQSLIGLSIGGIVLLSDLDTGVGPVVAVLAALVGFVAAAGMALTD